MLWVLLVLCCVIVLFGFVLLSGAPYLPTLKKQAGTAFELLDLQPGQVLLELGSGDGRVLAMAADRGIKAIGYELNPILVAYSRVRLWKYRGLAEVRFANFWSKELPECDGIYVFLLDKYMDKLYKKVMQEMTNPVRLVSFAFQIPGYKHTTEKNGLYLYTFNNKKTRNKARGH